MRSRQENLERERGEQAPENYPGKAPRQINRVTEPSLLLLIPAYNEESRIEPVLREYGRYFQQEYRGKFQLVVVLNGCKDNTAGVVQRVAQEFPFISYLD